MQTIDRANFALRSVRAGAVLAVALGVSGLSGCASEDAPDRAEPQRDVAASGCDVGAIRLTQSFSGAPGSRCVRTGPARFRLTIEPERPDINPSPWYAFDLHGARTEAVPAAEVVLEYAESRHRYRPKRRATGRGWQALPEEAVSTADEGRVARLRIPLSPNAGGSQRIAAQEVLDVADRRAWRRDFAQRHGYSVSVIGESLQGRPIEELHRSATVNDPPLVVIFGGQHPPEVPGVLGQRAFMEALERLDGESAQLIDRIDWLFIPALNPDGVEAGYWRLGTGGVDLNRDWGPFTQPETRAARDAIAERIESGSRPILLLDFHATRRDVLYLPERSESLDPTDLAGRWASAIRARMPPGEAFPQSRSHGVGRPTAKTWFADTYGRPGITVEFGDETDRAHIERLAAAAAKALVEVLSEDGH